MKIVPKIQRDSWNSYPKDVLEFVIHDKEVAITITDAGPDCNDNRTLTIPAQEFKRMLLAITLGVASV